MQPESHDTSPPSARGRDVTSKPLVATTASSDLGATSSSIPRDSENQDHSPRVSGEGTLPAVQGSKSSTPGGSSSSSGVQGSTSNPLPEPEFVVKAISVTTQPWGRRPSPPPRVDPRRTVTKPIVPSDDSSSASELVLSAEAYPWVAMTSTLDACFDSSDEPAPKVSDPEDSSLGSTSDESAKPEREPLVELPDEGKTGQFSKTAPAIMQTFHSHGDACAKAETDSLKLATRGAPAADVEEPLQDYYDMLSLLERLQNEAVSLEASISKLTSEFKDSEESEASARSQVLDVISGCLPVLRARMSNLSMAQELVDSAQENVSLGLRMEQLGLE